jgi:hypothetical protein
VIEGTLGRVAKRDLLYWFLFRIIATLSPPLGGRGVKIVEDE